MCAYTLPKEYRYFKLLTDTARAIVASMNTQRSPLIIGLVGEMASGKTATTDYLIQKYGAEPYKFSGMLRDILARIYQPTTRENLQKLSTAVRQIFGEDTMSKTIFQDLSHSTAPLIIAEGIRRPSDIEHLATLPRFVVVAIDADMRTRYERIIQRSENPDDQAKTWETFVAESQEEPEQKIREVMQRATHTINNNGTRDELQAQIDTLMQSLTV
jgi:dephospho-CoA kinase